jgi:dethiobiotin synthase
MKQAIFVTGTDTGVGKTIISALLCKALNAGYWKPVQSGVIEGTDRHTVADLTKLPPSHFYSESYSLREPLSPHAAAEIDGIEIDLHSIRLPSFNQDTLIVEGAGGVLVPLNRSYLMIDLMAQLKLPAIIVARSTLGTINHTLLTLQALRMRSVPVLGVILNGPTNPGNADAISRYGNTQILAQIELTDLNELINKNPLSHLAPIYSNENVRPAVAGAAC